MELRPNRRNSNPAPPAPTIVPREKFWICDNLLLAAVVVVVVVVVAAVVVVVVVVVVWVVVVVISKHNRTKEIQN
jgi:Flp pilus assembly protein TadB